MIGTVNQQTKLNDHLRLLHVVKFVSFTKEGARLMQKLFFPSSFKGYTRGPEDKGFVGKSWT